MATLVISYARADQPLVRGVVKLLRAAMSEIDDAVYWDEDFEPGAAWFDQIKHSIDEAPQLFVFWCAHSAASSQVLDELMYALNAGKVVVPVLLDDTSLSASLAPIHGVDLRTAVRHVATPHEHSTLRWLVPAALAATVLALSVVTWRTLQAGAPVNGHEYVVEARTTVPSANDGEGEKRQPPKSEPHPESRDSRLDRLAQSRLRQEQLEEALRLEASVQASLKQAERRQESLPGPASPDAGDGSRSRLLLLLSEQRVEHLQVALRQEIAKQEQERRRREAERREAEERETSRPTDSRPPSSTVPESDRESRERVEQLTAALGREHQLQNGLRQPGHWPSPPINEGMPESLMRALQLRESQLREARLRELWRRQEARRKSLERAIEPEGTAPPSKDASPAAVPNLPSVQPTQPAPTASADGPATDQRPGMLPGALVLALVVLLGVLVAMMRRRSKHTRSTDTEATAPDGPGGDQVLVLDERTRDALVRQFRRYLHLDRPTRI